MSRKIVVGTPVDEAMLARVARIVGPQSASAQALQDLATRRANNEDAVIYQHGTTFLVGPRITEEK